MKSKTRFAAIPIGVGLLLAVVLSAVSATGAAAQDTKPTIAVTSVDLAAGTVVISNHGDAEVDPNGVILCNFPEYAAIEGAEVIPAGGSITVDAGAHGITLDPDGGEFGLYLTNDYESAEAIISYVEWGEPGHQRSPVAIQAAIWTEGSAEAVDGVLTASGSAPVAPGDWAPAAQETAAADTTTELAQTGTEAWLMAGGGVFLLLAGALLLSLGRRQALL